MEKKRFKVVIDGLAGRQIVYKDTYAQASDYAMMILTEVDWTASYKIYDTNKPSNTSYNKKK